MRTIVLFLVGILCLGAGYIWAQSPDKAQAQTSAAPVDVANKTCPVSGRAIGVMGPGVQVTYNGKIYHLCCPGCVSTFNSDPAKYSKIAELR